ncbi:MAG: toprim domain-containing protein [Methanobacteriaceae archaeon]
MKSKESKEFKEDNSSNRPMDVRIIVEGASDVESISKAMKGISLGSDFHITISSIIPTVNVHVAKKAAAGADIVLVATDLDSAGKRLAKSYEEALEGLVGHVERVKFPNNHDVEYIDPNLIQDEICNAVIRAGLSFVFKIGDFNSIKHSLATVDENVISISNENEDLKSENYALTNRSSELEEENYSLKEKINNLNHELDDIKSQYSDFKSRYSNIYTKNLVEVFSINELWEITFNEHLDDENKVIFATSKFKPDNIITGQGWICAASKEDAIEWLKIIKTALIFTDYKTNTSNNYNATKLNNSNNNSNNMANSNDIGSNGLNNRVSTENNSPSYDYDNRYINDDNHDNNNNINTNDNINFNNSDNNGTNYEINDYNNINGNDRNNNNYNPNFNNYNNNNNSIDNDSIGNDSTVDNYNKDDDVENAVSNFFSSESAENKDKNQLNNFKNFWEH